MIDPVELGKQMASIVREATRPLLDRVSELEKALAEIPEPASLEIDIGEIARAAAELIPTPKDGVDADMEAIKGHIEGLVGAIPAPQDGKSITLDDVAPLIQEEVQRAVSCIPAPKDGESVTVEDVKPLLADLVSEAVKLIPAPRDGKDADMAELKLHMTELVKHIQLPSPPSVDEVAAVFERRFSDLTLSWERQARDTFERAVDRMPVPRDGIDGRDALPLESFDIVLGDDGRTVTVKMQAGDAVVEKSIKVATVLDRGQFKSDEKYEKGDGVSHGGCFWIAQKDSPEGAPGMGKSGWRLAVKKGRDGKDLRDNSSTADISKGVSIT